MDDFTNAFRGGYRKRAFFLQENLIALFGAGAFAAASASWLPLAAGAALELVWLLAAPSLPAFRRRVDVRFEVEAVPEPAQSPLDAAQGERAKRLGAVLREIHVQADDEVRRARSEELAMSLAVLPEVLAAFERSCKLHERLRRFLSQTSKEELDREVERLAQAFSKEKDLGLRVTLRQALGLAQRRLEQYGRISALERATVLRLDMIESAAAHVRACGLTAATPAELAAQIDGLTTHVASVNALEHDSAEAPQSQAFRHARGAAARCRLRRLKKAEERLTRRV